MSFCAACGKQLEEGSQFCNACGAAQGAPQAQPAQVPPPQAAQPQAPQQPQPYQQPLQPQAAAATSARRKSPFVAVAVVFLAAIVGFGGWWWLTQRTMSEAEYKKAAEEIIRDVGGSMASLEAMDTGDFEDGKEALGDAADDAQAAAGRAKSLNPPPELESAHEDLLDASEAIADMMVRMDDIAQRASSEDEAGDMLEDEFSEAEGLAFLTSFAKLASVMKELDIDPADVLGEEFAGFIGEANMDQGEFEGAQSSAQERSCFANQRTIEGAAQTYVADDVNNEITDLNGGDWEYILVPDFVRTAPTCPANGDRYYLDYGEVDPCPVHGHY